MLNSDLTSKHNNTKSMKIIPKMLLILFKWETWRCFWTETYMFLQVHKGWMQLNSSFFHFVAIHTNNSCLLRLFLTWKKWTSTMWHTMEWQKNQMPNWVYWGEMYRNTDEAANSFFVLWYTERKYTFILSKSKLPKMGSKTGNCRTVEFPSI